MFIVMKQPRVADARGIRPVTGGANPAVHPSYNLAEAEAHRLCAANPQFDYLIFGAQSKVMVTGAPTVVEKIEAN